MIGNRFPCFYKIKKKENIMALKDEKNIHAYGQTYNAMTPGSFAKSMRTCKIWQFFRFIAINIKMIVVVGKSH
jgi:hypothetical protein